MGKEEKKETILTIEDLKKAALSIQKMESKELPKTFSWISKIMARFGWHRKYEILVFDKSQFGFSNYFLNKKPEIKTGSPSQNNQVKK